MASLPARSPSPRGVDRGALAARDSLRVLGEQAFSRAAGAPLVEGNRIALLRDATENFPAWLDAIAGARQSVLLDTYILADDATGEGFAEALTAAAARGVRVRLLQDWLGALGEARPRFWRRLAGGGVEVRFFNPLRVARPLAWLRRNHRKCIVVDGRLGFVTGLCIADRWAGDPKKGVPPWRDTGVVVAGPAVADLARAFSRVWAEAGDPMPGAEVPRAEDIPLAGEAALRVIATEPSTSALYRLDQLIAATARRTLWVTDAYFVGTLSYVQALRAAAMDGVDVRFLVPGSSDLGFVKMLGTAGYRPLLEAGVRVFEWKGPMLHAKTAVADGSWARVGSSNLNLASWIGNWELDLAVENATFARQMERVFEEDLGHATEIVLGARRRGQRRAGNRAEHRGARQHPREGSAVATAGAIRIGNTVGAALSGYRVLGPAEARVLFLSGLAAILAAVAGFLFPRAVVFPFVVLGLWLGIALIIEARRLRRRHAERAPDGGDARAAGETAAPAPPGEDGA